MILWSISCIRDIVLGGWNLVLILPSELHRSFSGEWAGALLSRSIVSTSHQGMPFFCEWYNLTSGTKRVSNHSLKKSWVNHPFLLAFQHSGRWSMEFLSALGFLLVPVTMDLSLCVPSAFTHSKTDMQTLLPLSPSVMASFCEATPKTIQSHQHYKFRSS